MPTALFETWSTRLGHSLALAVWWGGWLMLGVFGQRYTPLLVDGVTPLAVWLGTTAATAQLAVLAGIPARGLSFVILLGAAVTGIALLWTADGGGAEALLLAAVSWGVLTVAVDRAALALPRASQCPAAYLTSSCLGAVFAWMAADRGIAGAVALMALSGPSLTILCSRASGRDVGSWRSSSRGMPIGWECMVSLNGGGVLQCVRVVMLPMMASLAFSSEWCAGSGPPDRMATIGMHLVGMFLLPCLLNACGARVPAGLLVLLMGVSTLILVFYPGGGGLMVASMTQAVAWGLSYAVGPELPRKVSGPPGGLDRRQVLIALCAVIVVGLVGAAVGPALLSSLHFALGVGAVALALLQWLEGEPLPSLGEDRE